MMLTGGQWWLGARGLRRQQGGFQYDDCKTSDGGGKEIRRRRGGRTLRECAAEKVERSLLRQEGTVWVLSEKGQELLLMESWR